MNDKKTQNNITVDDISPGLYQYYNEEKKHDLAQILRFLMLREDFPTMLKKIEDTCKNWELKPKKDRLGILMQEFDENIIHVFINPFIEKALRAEYFYKQDDSLKSFFERTAPHLIRIAYLDTYVNNKLNLPFSGTVCAEASFLDKNISHAHFTLCASNEMLHNFYKNIKTIQQKYEHDITQITLNGPPHTEDSYYEKPDLEKVCHIIIREDAEKQDVLDYINNNWETLTETLRAARPPKKIQRSSMSKTFLRDLDIYNTYQNFKNDGYKNPDVKTYSWLKNESEYHIEIEPNTVRKIVSLLQTDINLINGEK